MEEKVFFVKNEDLEEVNKVLAKGGKVKMISAVAESVSMGGEEWGKMTGDKYAYIIVEMPE